MSEAEAVAIWSVFAVLAVCSKALALWSKGEALALWSKAVVKWAKAVRLRGGFRLTFSANV